MSKIIHFLCSGAALSSVVGRHWGRPRDDSCRLLPRFSLVSCPLDFLCIFPRRYASRSYVQVVVGVVEENLMPPQLEAEEGGWGGKRGGLACIESHKRSPQARVLVSQTTNPFFNRTKPPTPLPSLPPPSHSLSLSHSIPASLSTSHTLCPITQKSRPPKSQAQSRPRSGSSAPATSPSRPFTSGATSRQW